MKTHQPFLSLPFPRAAHTTTCVLHSGTAEHSTRQQSCRKPWDFVGLGLQTVLVLHRIGCQAERCQGLLTPFACHLAGRFLYV